MNHKCIIICESIYNDNTLKLAKAMAQTLVVNCITADEALLLNLDDYETIGLVRASTLASTIQNFSKWSRN
jgi:hypothetical protein